MVRCLFFAVVIQNSFTSILLPPAEVPWKCLLSVPFDAGSFYWSDMSAWLHESDTAIETRFEACVEGVLVTQTHVVCVASFWLTIEP